MFGVWRAHPNQNATDNAPVNVTLTLYLYGPFATEAERQQFRDGWRERVAALENVQSPPGRFPVATSLPVRTDTWSSAPWVAGLELADTLRPGLYIFEQIAVAPGLWSSTSQTPIAVAASG